MTAYALGDTLSSPPPPDAPGAGQAPDPTSGQPWSTPSGDALAPEPPRPTYRPGYASLPDPNRPNPNRPDLGQSDPTRLDPNRPGPNQPDPTRIDPNRPESNQPDPTRIDRNRPESGQPDPTRVDSGRPQSYGPPTMAFPPVPPLSAPPPGQASYAPPGQPNYAQSGQASYAPPGQPNHAQSGQASYGPPGQPNYAPPGQPPDYGQSQPPGYPPPGHQPSGYHPNGPHQQQNYAQPGYPPPGRAPRRSNLPLVAVIVVVTLLLCGGVATAGVLIARNVTDRAKEAVSNIPTAVPELPGVPTDLPTLPTGGPDDGIGRTVDVTYEITGDGPARILYVAKLGETPTRLENVSLPWRFEATMETPALLTVVAMRLEASEGSITCRALVDDEVVREKTSEPGNFATASCTYLALD